MLLVCVRSVLVRQQDWDGVSLKEEEENYYN